MVGMGGKQTSSRAWGVSQRTRIPEAPPFISPLGQGRFARGRAPDCGTSSQGPSLLHQNMDGEVATDAAGCFKKSDNYRFNIFEVRDHFGFPDRAVRVVVRKVSFALHLRERLPELPHLVRKPGRHVLAALPGLPVLQRSIDLAPRRPVADLAGAAGQTVRAGARQTVEQGVVRGADGAAQIRPTRPAGVDLHKVGGYLQEVLWIHDTTLRPIRPPTRR